MITKKNVFVCYAGPPTTENLCFTKENKGFLKMPMTGRFQQKPEKIIKKTLFLFVIITKKNIFCHFLQIYRKPSFYQGKQSFFEAPWKSKQLEHELRRITALRFLLSAKSAELLKSTNKQNHRFSSVKAMIFMNFELPWICSAEPN